MMSKLENYHTSPRDISDVVTASILYRQINLNRPKVPIDGNLRINQQLFVVVDTREKILLLPPGLPPETYKDSMEIKDFPGWKKIPTPLTNKDLIRWLQPDESGKYKLGSYSAWDNDLNINDGSPAWEGVVRSLTHISVWNRSSMGYRHW